jgi:hypothetical protein
MRDRCHDILINTEARDTQTSRAALIAACHEVFHHSTIEAP